MGQLELILDTRSLFEKLCNAEYLRQGFRAVKANRGAPGIDGVSIVEARTDIPLIPAPFLVQFPAI